VAFSFSELDGHWVSANADVTIGRNAKATLLYVSRLSSDPHYPNSQAMRYVGGRLLNTLLHEQAKAGSVGET